MPTLLGRLPLQLIPTALWKTLRASAVRAGMSSVVCLIQRGPLSQNWAALTASRYSIRWSAPWPPSEPRLFPNKILKFPLVLTTAVRILSPSQVTSPKWAPTFNKYTQGGVSLMTPKHILDGFSETLMRDERILSPQERALLATLLQHAKTASPSDPEIQSAVNAAIASAVGETVAHRAFTVLGTSIVERLVAAVGNKEGLEDTTIYAMPVPQPPGTAVPQPPGKPQPISPVPQPPGKPQPIV